MTTRCNKNPPGSFANIFFRLRANLNHMVLAPCDRILAILAAQKRLAVGAKKWAGLIIKGRSQCPNVSYHQAECLQHNYPNTSMRNSFSMVIALELYSRNAGTFVFVTVTGGGIKGPSPLKVPHHLAECLQQAAHAHLELRLRVCN